MFPNTRNRQISFRNNFPCFGWKQIFLLNQIFEREDLANKNISVCNSMYVGKSAGSKSLSTGIFGIRGSLLLLSIHQLGDLSLILDSKERQL